jgi:proteasome lid subunit RPN8/RPN11
VVCLDKSAFSELVREAQRDAAKESCGLLAGRAGAITRILPAPNDAASPATAYEIAPEELFRLMREIRSAGLEFMGIYHSHPNGDNKPSTRDIDQAYYPDVAYFILSPREDRPKSVRAFSIRDGKAAELIVQIV